MAYTHFFEFICSTLDTGRELFSKTPTLIFLYGGTKQLAQPPPYLTFVLVAEEIFHKWLLQTGIELPSTTTANTFFLSLFPLFYFQVQTNAFSIFAAIGSCFWQLEVLKGILNFTREHCPTLVTYGSISLKIPKSINVHGLKGNYQEEKNHSLHKSQTV